MKRLVVPTVIVMAGFGLAALLLATGPTLSPQPVQALIPLVRVQVVTLEDVELSSLTHGTVAPRTESELVAEVAGRVISVNPNLVSGGFFAAGEELLRIDPLDYELALEQAKANLVQAESDLANAQGNSSRLDSLSERQLTSVSQQDDATNRLRIAEATLRSSQAQLARAERDLTRTRFLAPFEGRVRSERVDIGQFVNRGNAIAVLYATDYAEVRLPINDAELAILDLPLVPVVGEVSTLAATKVTISARFAGEEHHWPAQIVRTEGEIDPLTRMIHLVARVDAPYARVAGRAPLAVGLFVNAEIHGRLAQNVAVLPRSAVRQNDRVLVVDSDSRLQFRSVSVMRTVGELAYIDSGLVAGDRVCISSLDTAIEGMTVRMVGAEPLDNSDQSL
ncbi:efflux RND transporter periplasmic adaptor subunit [Halieaceae bacterium IMCC14734]|uniref:Efflux RND transporter periplasmic adaptor subunit n=1 Tax=Candidatus Litorirhabdus singularis TaxID=2518993 RepID=A0ABT3TCP6_9GAMM|nr:efflux RND transporter periplasmic adaptor subunit [Candidatus Litorirhabdus singularis]MCX2979576.1 efflux RND transporter periplasmic adaptor subunit [Candidatus Litorirhabdus singularis]